MSQIDQKVTLGSSTIEFHVGNPQGSPGQNAQGPGDAPIVGQKVVITKQVNATVGSSHVVNPA